jgi:hypothetical protein
MILVTGFKRWNEEKSAFSVWVRKRAEVEKDVVGGL